jgi:hypothetical protein
MPGRVAGALITAVLLASCVRPYRPTADIDLATCIPRGADAAAYANLDRLRSTPLYPKLPLPDAMRDASALLAVLRGAEWAIAARGRFPQPPAGATMIGPGIAAAGPPDLLQAMAAQHRTGAASDLVALAPADDPVWLVARGAATFPLGGNWNNLNRLLHQAETVSIGIRVSGTLRLTANAVCRTPAHAEHLEENLRAMATLARLESVQVSGTGTSVHVSAAVPADSLPPFTLGH